MKKIDRAALMYRWWFVLLCINSSLALLMVSLGELPVLASVMMVFCCGMTIYWNKKKHEEIQ